jgi:HSP20 family protein
MIGQPYEVLEPCEAPLDLSEEARASVQINERLDRIEQSLKQIEQPHRRHFPRHMPLYGPHFDRRYPYRFVPGGDIIRKHYVPGYLDLFPRVDIIEFENEVRLLADLPGFTKEDIKVQVLDNLNSLQISGVRKEESEVHLPKSQNMLLAERPRGEFNRVLKLPPFVSLDNCTAVLSNGLLEIVFPKIKTQFKTREITVYDSPAQVMEIDTAL